MPNEMGALIVYGRGDTLGNFKFFADDLATTELASYKDHIQIRNVERRDAFFDLLRRPPIIIKELHIFAHSIGAGLFLGYGDQFLKDQRLKTINRFRGSRTPYHEVLNTEEGAILTDDLIRRPYADYREQIRANFASDAKIKIWGCNSAVSDWLYSDPVNNTGREYTSDPNAPALYFYWRTLNLFNYPKPAIAQAFANYFRLPTYGAGSGSNIQVRHKGRWIWSPEFLKITGRRSVNEADVLRLAPESGDYYEFRPQ